MMRYIEWQVKWVVREIGGDLSWRSWPRYWSDVKTHILGTPPTCAGLSLRGSSGGGSGYPTPAPVVLTLPINTRTIGLTSRSYGRTQTKSTPLHRLTYTIKVWRIHTTLRPARSCRISPKFTFKNYTQHSHRSADFHIRRSCRIIENTHPQLFAH